MVDCVYYTFNFLHSTRESLSLSILFSRFALLGIHTTRAREVLLQFAHNCSLANCLQSNDYYSNRFCSSSTTKIMRYTWRLTHRATQLSIRCLLYFACLVSHSMFVSATILDRTTWITYRKSRYWAQRFGFNQLAIRVADLFIKLPILYVHSL